MSDPTVDPQQPWLGLNSFTESTRQFFYGREEEIAELARRVQRKPLTVLFGQSGLGKTSILRAGLVPRLRPEGYCPVYVRLDYGADSPPPAAQIKQAIYRETLASGTWTRTGAAVEGESLWEFLHHRDDVLRDAEGRTLTPLLIFDQFEEIFTLAQGNDAGRRRAAEFVDELADLVENRPPKALESRLDAEDGIVERFDFARCDYRVLIALREDYLAHLESLKASMPSITQNRMRLARMTGQQALDAVVKPGGALVSQEVAEAIVRFVAGGAELRNAEVEPSLLSLICRELNAARIAQGRAEISADLLAGSHATILAEFYERALADQPPGVRRFIEDQLLTESGFRENIAQERVLKAFAEAGAAPDALARLVDRRLLRVEERLDVRRVELTHDVLCGVVAASRSARQEREARDAAEAQLAAQREREAATRRALVRARQVAAVCVVLAVLAVGAAAFGIYGMRQAQIVRGHAEAARGEAERLIVYLLDDFYRELEPVGRLEIVGDLARRALDYYARLPAELRGAETRRNQALAQVRHGAVLRNQGRIDEARQVLEAAVPTLDGLRAGGDASEPTAIGLALGLMAQARLETGLESVRSLVLAQRAVEVLDPVARAADASVALRRAHAAALTQFGFIQQRAERNEAALVTLQAALEAYRGIDGLRDDGDAAANFAITSAWLMDALAAAGRPADALRVGDEARAVATRLLERQPTHMLALRARALLASNASRSYGELLQAAERVRAADAGAEDWLLLSRIDPTNMITVHNLGVARNNASDGLWALGRPREAAAKRVENRAEQEAVADRSAMVRGILAGRLGDAAWMNAELGQVGLAERQWTDSLRFFEGWRKSLGPDSFEGRVWSRAAPVFAVEQAAARGDLAGARAGAKGARDGLLQVDPGDDPQQRVVRANHLRRLHMAMARVEIESNDWAAADRQLRWVAEARRDLPSITMESRRDNANELALGALVLARLGRVDEARPKAGQALAFQRELHAMATDDQMHKLDLAIALVAAAGTEPSRAADLLAEAEAAYDSLPAEARALRTSRWVEGLIADARRGAR
jgi:tetratricopeptide (TPR) repeat protein